MAGARETGPDRQIPERLIRLGPAAAAAFTTVVCLPGLGSRGLDGDEVFAALMAQRPWGQTWRILTSEQANMSLHQVLLWLWAHAFGSSEIALRFPSLAAAAIASALFFRLAARLGGFSQAVVAGLVLTLNGFFIHYAQEARAYSLMVMVLIAAALTLLNALETNRWTWWVANAVLISAAMYCHFYSAFVVVGFGVAILAHARFRFVWRRALAVHAAALVLVSPLLAFLAFGGDKGQIDWIWPLSFTTLALNARFFAGGSVALALLLAALVTVGMVGGFRQRKRSSASWTAIFLGAWFAAPVTLAILVSVTVKPIFVAYYLIVSLPPLCLLVSRGALALKGPARFGVIAALIVLLGNTAVNQYHSNRDTGFRGLEAAMVASSQPHDVVAFSPFSFRRSFEFYLLRRGDGARLQPISGTPPWGQFSLHLNDRRPDVADPCSRVPPGGRLWLVGQPQTCTTTAHMVLLATYGAGESTGSLWQKPSSP